ncbi:hypothetical protein ACIRVK_41825 [Streptomyces sp. NPDC101152]
MTTVEGRERPCSYRENAMSIGSAAMGSATRQTVAAYSMVVVQLHRAP